MQKEAAAIYTRFTSGRRLSQRGARPRRKRTLLVCAQRVGTAGGRAGADPRAWHEPCNTRVSVARDGLLPAHFFANRCALLQRIYTARGRELLASPPACKPRSPAFSSSRTRPPF